MAKIKNVSGYDQVIVSDHCPKRSVANGDECEVPEAVADELADRPGWKIPNPQTRRTPNKGKE